MSTFTADPIYELTNLADNLCYVDTIELAEYDNSVNDTGYTYSGLTLVLDYQILFVPHFNNMGHTYSNVMLNNDIYTYTGLTDEIHYFRIMDFYEGGGTFIDPNFGPLTQDQLISGFTTNIISCIDKLDGLTGTCCSIQSILSNLPVVMITNTGGGTDNCDDYIARRTPKGWTLDFVFNKNGDTGWSGSTFFFTGVRDEYDVLNYADNGLSFKFTDEGKIVWTSYRYSGYCDTVSGYTEMYYIDTGGTTNALCSGGTLNDFNITITFERNNVYDDECDLANEGGWNDLVITGTTEELNSKWNNSRDKRLGTLKIYHNARLIHKLKNFEEVILSDRGYQPFTHVVGGGVTGSGGVHEGICCYDIKYVAYFEDVMDFVYLHNRYETETTQNYAISECEVVCVPAVVMVTPTRTPSITPTQTVTPTVTRTPSRTPSVTRTPSITPTPVRISTLLGLLYSSCVIDDPRNLTAANWHVPTKTELEDLETSLGSFPGGELKETGIFPSSYWYNPNVGATNSVQFNGRGGGRRLETGVFESLYEFAYFWTSTSDIFGNNYQGRLSYISTSFTIGTSSRERGNSIRLVSDSTTLTHGQIGTYVGNNGQIYRTIAISGSTGTQEWLSSNLAETRFRTGEYIPELRTNDEWSGGTVCGYCAYNNNWSYVPAIAPTPSISPTISFSSTRTPSITPSPSPLPPLSLTFDDINNIPTGITDPSIVSEWNTFFDLPTYGTPFSSVSVIGNTVNLYGGNEITLKQSLFFLGLDEFMDPIHNTSLLSVNDQIGCIVNSEDSSFGYCTALVTVNFPQLLTGGTYSFYHNEALTNVSFPSMTNVLDYCFEYCISLINPNFSSVLSIGDSAFIDCTGLTNPNFSSLVDMGPNCFMDCYNLSNPNFSSLTIVGGNSFGYCTSLVDPDFFQQITEIGTRGFEGCTGLTNPNFSSLITVGDEVFWDCLNLSDINFSNVTTVGTQAFLGCLQLTGITLPSCTSLGDSVGDNSVFYYISGNTINLIVPAALMTCNSGNPDGDIQYLQANNTVTTTPITTILNPNETYVIPTGTTSISFMYSGVTGTTSTVELNGVLFTVALTGGSVNEEFIWDYYNINGNYHNFGSGYTDSINIIVSGDTFTIIYVRGSTFVTISPIPTGLILTSISDTEIDGEFTINDNGQDGHKVYISTDNLAYNLYQTLIGADNTFQATGLTAGTLYYFYVKAYDGNLIGSRSNIAVEITLSDNGPTNVQANPITGGILITWTDILFNNGDVHIFASIDSGDWNELAVVADDVQSYTHSIIGNHTVDYKLYAEISPDPLSEEYQDILDQMTTPPTGITKYMQNQIVETLVTDGVWTNNISGFWIFAGHTNNNSESLINWRHPTWDKAVLINNPSFQAGYGFSGDVANQRCIDLKWNGVDDADGKFSQNLASFLIGTPNSGSAGALTGSGHYLSSYNRIGYTCEWSFHVNPAHALGTAQSWNTKGYFSVIRNASDNENWYKNKGSAVNGTTASAAPCPYDWRVLATATGTSSQEIYSNGAVSVIVAGNFNETQKNTIIDAIETYMVYVNNGLI